MPSNPKLVFDKRPARGETRAGRFAIIDMMDFTDEPLRLTNRFCNDEHNLPD